MVGLTGWGEGMVLTPLGTGAFVSLHTADPGNTGANEVTGGGYTRMAATFAQLSGPNPTVDANSAIITFPAATADWAAGAPITHFGVWDAATAGNNRGSGALTTPKAVHSGDTARFAANALTITAQ